MVSDDRLCAFRAGDKEVLILFLSGSDPKGTRLTFGWLPPHGTTGSSHIGFAIPENGLTSWKAKLKELKIPIESELTWPEGGTSVYFRDPDNHLLELITPGVWDNY